MYVDPGLYFINILDRNNFLFQINKNSKYVASFVFKIFILNCF